MKPFCDHEKESSFTMTIKEKHLHFLYRTSFSPSLGASLISAKKEFSEFISNELARNLKEPTYIDSFGGMIQSRQENRMMTDEQRNKSKGQLKTQLEQLSQFWYIKMATSEQQIREKMVLFWHGHFASYHINPTLVQRQNNLFRKHALGSFRTLLHEVARDTVMMTYLQMHKNKKSHPNENFAREVMELFTLGEGNYTEQDIKEAARAFTGWGLDDNMSFVFEPEEHDSGEKTIFGKTKKWTGIDVLDALLENKQTAYYISKKLFRFYVNNIPSEEHIQLMAEVLYDSDYNIGKLMKFVFQSDWFYSKENQGAVIKSPIELLVTYKRRFGTDFLTKKAPTTIQKALGQRLFHPPNVSGWAGGKQWIDTARLAYRLSLPDVIFNHYCCSL